MEAEIRRIQSAEPDAFEGIKDLGVTFHGVADYLSLWCELYGLREHEIRFGPIELRKIPTLTTPAMLSMKVTRNWHSPIHPLRWDPRLPHVPRVFLRRQFRIKRFLVNCPRFRGALKRMDIYVRALLGELEIPFGHSRQRLYEELEVINRWAPSGQLVFRLVPPWITGARRLMTHYQHE